MFVIVSSLLTHPEGDRSADEVYSTRAPLPVNPRLVRGRAVRVVEVHLEPAGAIFVFFRFQFGRRATTGDRGSNVWPTIVFLR